MDKKLKVNNENVESHQHKMEWKQKIIFTENQNFRTHKNYNLSSDKNSLK